MSDPQPVRGNTIAGVGLVMLFAALAAALLGTITALAGSVNSHDDMLIAGMAIMSMSAVFALLSAVLILKARDKED